MNAAAAAAPDLPPVDAVADILRTLAAGYLRNPLALLGVTCDVCRGPSTPGASHCPQCRNARNAFGDHLASRVGVFTYAPDDGQTSRAMYGYKSATVSREHQALVTLMCHVALRGHIDCVGTLAGASVTHWATVPSQKGRPGEHPLHLIVRRIAREGTEMPLVPHVAYDDPREVHLDAFAIPQGTNATGAHVLLVDDTWARGGHAQSAAAALTQAGAQVSVLVLARWLKMSWSDHKAFARDHLTEDFDVSRCPWTAAGCPDKPR